MLTTRRPRGRSTRGISTAEVLVGTALSLMAVLAMYSVFKVQSTAFAAHNAYAESQVVTRSVIDLMTRELRMATYDPTGIGNGGAIPVTAVSCPGLDAGITAASGTSISFSQDLNGDGLLAGTGEVVTYAFVGSQLRRVDGVGLPVVLVDNIPANGFRLRYYNDSNPPVELSPGGGVLPQSDLNCIQKVRVVIRAQIPNPAQSGPMHSMAESEIAIRNRALTNTSY